MADPRPLCFVLMPFGSKPDPTGGRPIDFDRIYFTAIRPAIAEAGLESIRSDEERGGGIIHRAMFERLLLCEYAIADLTTANANVFYELGVRHAARPRSTLTLFARHQPIPFDLNMIPALGYELGSDHRFGEAEATVLRENLVQRLHEMRRVATEHDTSDSPLFQLLGEWRPGSLARLKTDVFRDQVRIAEDLKLQMANARRDSEGGVDALVKLHEKLGRLDLDEAAVIVDLMLSFRALEAWTHMIELYDAMPEALKRQVLIREQLAFALNRRATKENRPRDQQRALEILEGVERDQGPSSETCGLIGRIHKDRWDAARGSQKAAAQAHLRKAVAAYTRGFEADWRDAYPGVNAVTLLEIQGDAASRAERDRLLPVVRFSVQQRLRTLKPDYWDYATLLELAVLASNREMADQHLGEALAAEPEGWMKKTTARNLTLIQEARGARGEATDWIPELVSELSRIQSTREG